MFNEKITMTSYFHNGDKSSAKEQLPNDIKTFCNIIRKFLADVILIYLGKGVLGFLIVRPMLLSLKILIIIFLL